VNSLVASGCITLLVLVLATPAAYALSLRPVAKWRDVLFFLISLCAGRCDRVGMSLTAWVPVGLL
jgi:ABC-type glycerol-3-phosphate transport system permease component